MDKLTFLFSFFFLGIFLTQGQEVVSRKIKTIPFSIHETEDYNTDLLSLLETNPSFVPIESYQKKYDHSKTYWLKLDFTKELDTLEIHENWKLRTSFFHYAVMYHKTQNGIDSIPFGMHDNPIHRISIDYGQGVSFTKKNLIEGCLFVKFKTTHRAFKIKDIEVGYTSNASDTLYTDYY